MKKPRKPIDKPEQVEAKEYQNHGFSVLHVSVKSEEAAKRLRKEIGDYITIQTGDLSFVESGCTLGNCLAELLEPALAPYFQKRVCICGLGNPNIISDSLGPAAIDKLPAFFLEERNADSPGRFSKLVTIKPDVLNATNLPTEVYISGIIAAAKADCLILIDSLGLGDTDRICNNIQIATAGGTSPHAGHVQIDWNMVGVPVITIGVPTVLNPKLCQKVHLEEERNHWLTPYLIQNVIENAAAIIAYALIKVSYPSLSDDDCASIVYLKQAAQIAWD